MKVGKGRTMWKRARPEKAEERAETELGEECALFLAGAYRDFLEAHDRPIPAWAWINSLAHGDRANAERAAAMRNGEETPDALVAEIAAAALTALKNGATLESLQRNTLVPLELALAATHNLPPTNSAELGRALASARTARLSLTPTRRLSQ